jgi:phosphate transport system protein
MAQATDEHTVKSYDQELSDLTALVLRMGGLVQEQITRAMQALRERDVELARDVIARDHVVNFMDVQVDERSVNLLARRQPMGRDLRTIMSLEKTVTDLERIGDEAERIARMTIHLVESGRPQPSPRLLRDTYGMARIASAMLNDVLDALARLDVEQALEVAKGDAELDSEFQSALRRLATYLMEDSRNVGHVISATLVLKSIERIGDHAKNIAEYVVYLVKGKDVRHVSPETLERDLLGEKD